MIAFLNMNQQEDSDRTELWRSRQKWQKGAHLGVGREPR